MRRAGWILVLLLGLLAAPTPTAENGTGDQSPGPGVLYRLEKGSTFQRGCFDPCECPIMEEVPVRGSFRLVPAGFDPLFEHFSVRNLLAYVSIAGQAKRVTGSGTYLIGGEFARQHRLVLDLEIGDEPVRRFDSGLQLGGAEFPAIVIAVSLNGQYCFDTVFDLRAAPWRRIRVEPDGVHWDAAPPGVVYDVVRGSLDTLRATGGDFSAATLGCAADDTAATSLLIEDDPPAGEAHWFVLREVGTGGDPSWDEGDAAQYLSRDPGIAASPSPCP